MVRVREWRTPFLGDGGREDIYEVGMKSIITPCVIFLSSFFLQFEDNRQTTRSESSSR